jgi:hypothetical protein
MRVTLCCRSSLAVALTACGTSEPPLTDAVSLACPIPGDLPFRLPSHGFRNAANAKLVKTDTRIKDEAADWLGNAGGTQANMFLPDDQAPSASPIAYQGMKARTEPTQGLFTEPLPGEYVSLWDYEGSGSGWRMLGRGETDSDGEYDFAGTSFIAPNASPVYAMLEADGTCATHYDYLLPPGDQVIVLDIDGTLTTSNNRHVPQPRVGPIGPRELAGQARARLEPQRHRVDLERRVRAEPVLEAAAHRLAMTHERG